MPRKLVPISDFTVGWVCALDVELAAAFEMMDEIYQEHPIEDWDTNNYTYGRIGPHNVVAASLPSGQTGTNSAATVVKEMSSKFRSIRFGVLVGIGGGVPNLDRGVDIRLGDVVISQPEGAHGGVIQYDMGKTLPHGQNTRTGHLDAPPRVLLTALTKFRANIFRDKERIRTHLQNLPSDYAMPDEIDVLCVASSTHVGGGTCADCHPDDKIHRAPRKRAGPMVFYGNIASGNQVMRDGVARDRYSQSLEGVLCFEMEAAGLMNNFPCLVFRGICDYADAHKNDSWQPYAAATAAATAKELLYTIPGNLPLPPIPNYDKLPFTPGATWMNNIVCASFYVVWLLALSVSLGIATVAPYPMFSMVLAVGISSGLPIMMEWVKILKTQSPLLAGLLCVFPFILTSILIYNKDYPTVAFGAWLVYWSAFWVEGIFRVLDRLSEMIQRSRMGKSEGNNCSGIESARRPGTSGRSDTENELLSSEETALLLV